MESDATKLCSRCSKTLSEVFNEWEHETEERCSCEMPKGSEIFRAAMSDLTSVANTNISAKERANQECSCADNTSCSARCSSPSTHKSLCGKFRWVCFGKLCVRQPVIKTRSKHTMSWI